MKNLFTAFAYACMILILMAIAFYIKKIESKFDETIYLYVMLFLFLFNDIKKELKDL